MRRQVARSRLTLALFACLAAHAVSAAEHTGQVTFSGLPVPGATVTATQGDQRVTTVTDEQGSYRFPDLADGTWSIQVDMVGFGRTSLDVPIAPGGMPVMISLTLRPFADLTAGGTTVRADTVVNTPTAPTSDAATPAAQPANAAAPDASADLASAAADGFLVNGSVNNGASTPFAQAAAFGNNRNLRRSLYNGTLGAVLGRSAWDSRPFSFTGAQGAKPDYGDLQFLATFGGPIPTRGALQSRPNLFSGYQRSVEHSATTQSTIVPSLLERGGDFSQSVDAAGRPLTIRDPLTDQPFTSAQIPTNRLSPQAQALVALYPQPNVAGGGRFNYQAPVLTRTQQDSLQTRITQNLNNRNQVFGTLQYQRVENQSTSLFGFTSASRTATTDATGSWSRRFSPFFSSRLRYQFTRATTSTTPHFAGTTDMSGTAGIQGTDRATENWGPPSLTFSSGVLGLADAQYAESSTRTHGVALEGLVYRGRHNITIGGGIKRVSVDAHGQQNGRGAFSFTGAATGSDVADFMLGLPRTAALASGNSDKSLRANAIEAYFTDDWRLTPGFTLNAGLRWDYEGPFSEKLARLTNLDLAPGFTAASVVTPSTNVGSLTGREFGQSLLRPDRSGLQPRLGIAWRPIAGSSLVVRAGYGIYRNTSNYQALTLLMAQQPPFSTAISVESSPTTPLTLRDGLLTSAASPATFAVDPDFRVSSAQNWQLLAQRDLPASLTLSAAYLGAYGRHLMQEVLPNTYPAGTANPCFTCPIGFAYLTSNGTSIRHAGQFQLRRRLRNGFQASAQYTIAKATDNAGAFSGASLSGTAIAQDWRDLEAERGPSAFDQRHLFTAQVQYTTGVGVTGGGLLTGAKGALVKGWTFTSQMSAGSGLPLTASYLGAVPGTGVTGTLRASRTGSSLTPPDGYYLNPAAFTAPGPGSWGDAGRNSLTGPSQFSMSAGIARSFPWGDRATLDWRIDATNVLNVVTYAAVNTVVGSSQFGLPTRANPMRKLQTTIRFRF
ncbi:MAG: carboxypeptidase-like regulatory domain-containing protein [Vicinamibacterales bacterium]